MNSQTNPQSSQPQNPSEKPSEESTPPLEGIRQVNLEQFLEELQRGFQIKTVTMYRKKKPDSEKPGNDAQTPKTEDR